jgi:hypothetical protein
VKAGDFNTFFYILFVRRNSKAAMVGSCGGGRWFIVFFRVPNSLEGCDAMGRARAENIIYQSLGGTCTVESYTPLAAA